MTNEIETFGPRVQVWLKKSSTKDGGEGYEINVQEGADNEEADRVLEMALRLRDRAVEALKPRPLTEQLEDAIAAMPPKHRDVLIDQMKDQLGAKA